MTEKRYERMREPKWSSRIRASGFGTKGAAGLTAGGGVVVRTVSRKPLPDILRMVTIPSLQPNAHLLPCAESTVWKDEAKDCFPCKRSSDARIWVTH